MPIKKLTHIQYSVIERNKALDIYHPRDTETPNTEAIIFAHATLSLPAPTAILPAHSPGIAYLAPAGYELFAVRGQLSDYRMAEVFDHTLPGEEYFNYQLSAPGTDIFHHDDQDHFLLSVHRDFDIIVIRETQTLSELLDACSSLQSYQQLLFHCSRRHEGDQNIKYFLPVEQHAHILAQNKPLDWSSF